MLLTYDHASDDLTFRWNRDHEGAEWRMARSHVDLYVDYAGECSGVNIRKASMFCPELSNAATSFETEIDAATLCLATLRHYQAQLPWDEIPAPLPAHVPGMNLRSRRGFCRHCGSKSTSRRAPCKVDGWSQQDLCPRCQAAPIDAINAAIAQPISREIPAGPVIERFQKLELGPGDPPDPPRRQYTLGRFNRIEIKGRQPE